MPTCTRCGQKQGLMSVFTADLTADKYICDNCKAADSLKQEQDAKQASQAEKRRQDQIKQAALKVLVTTTQSIDGYYVKKYIGIESVEYVIGTGLFSEVTSDFADFFGARSTAFEKKLQVAKQNAFFVLK